MTKSMDAMDVLKRRGAMEILAEFTKPLRYAELKKRTGLPDSTLTARIRELLRAGFIEQKPLVDKKSGRYYLAYDIKGGEETRRSFKIGFEWAVKQMVAERLLEEAHIKAIWSLPDLTKKEKEKAEKYFIEKFQRIKELINRECTRAYYEAVARAREARQERNRQK